MKIRCAQAADASEIARLSGELGYPNSPGDIAARLSVLLADADHFIAVAVGDEPRLCGWVAAERRLLLEYGERVELVGLVVGADARRTRLGSALVAQAEDWARSRGAGTIVVRSNTARVESHPFYEALGYVRTKTQHAYSKSLAVRE